MRHFFLTFLSILFTLGNVAFARPTQNEFHRGTVEHIQRVEINAPKILTQFSEYFPELMGLPSYLRVQFLTVYLGTHDKPKLMNIEELRQLGYKGERTFFEKLYDNWGKALKRRPPFIQELNAIESEYKDRVINANFSKIFSRDHLQRLLREVAYLEFIADETDTKIHRGAELGVDTKPLDAEHMFREFYSDEVAAKISRWLELKVYKRESLILFCEGMFRSAGTAN